MDFNINEYLEKLTQQNKEKTTKVEGKTPYKKPVDEPYDLSQLRALGSYVIKPIAINNEIFRFVHFGKELKFKDLTPGSTSPMYKSFHLMDAKNYPHLSSTDQDLVKELLGKIKLLNGQGVKIPTKVGWINSSAYRTFFYGKVVAYVPSDAAESDKNFKYDNLEVGDIRLFYGTGEIFYNETFDAVLKWANKYSENQEEFMKVSGMINGSSSACFDISVKADANRRLIIVSTTDHTTPIEISQEDRNKIKKPLDQVLFNKHMTSEDLLEIAKYVQNAYDETITNHSPDPNRSAF